MSSEDEYSFDGSYGSEDEKIGDITMDTNKQSDEIFDDNLFTRTEHLTSYDLDIVKSSPIREIGVTIDSESGTTNLMEKGIFPHPIVVTTEVVDDKTQANIPGEITISPSGKLLRKYLSYEGFLADTIMAYDTAISTGIPNNLLAREIKLPNNHIIRFTSVRYQIPRENEMTPLRARERDLSYTANVIATVTEFPNENSTQILNTTEVNLGRLPIMLGSILDPLRGKTDNQRAQLGECVKDPQGYFIITGNEYVVLLRDQVRIHKIMITARKGTTSCTMTCRTKIGTVVVSISSAPMSEPNISSTTSSDKTIVMKLRFTKIHYINIFIIYYLLGITNTNDIMDRILTFVKSENRNRVRAMLIITYRDFIGLEDNTQMGQGTVKTIQNIMNETQHDIQISREQYINYIKKDLFPQIPEGDVVNKLNLLSVMISRYVEVVLGLRDMNSRDNWSNKRITSAGPKISQLFGKCITSAFIKLFRSNGQIKKLEAAGNSNYFHEIIGDNGIKNKITDSFHSSFTGDWGCRGEATKEQGATELVSRSSILDTYSHLSQIKTKQTKKAKSTQIRMVEMSQLGYVCPIYSPEGDVCGIIKAKAVSCWVSIDRQDDIIQSIINDENIVSLYRTDVNTNLCILNGRSLGWCNPESSRQLLINKRRQGLFDKDIMIVVDSDGILWIDTGDQRPTRPLLIVNQETGNLIIDEKDLRGESFDKLISQGAVEYLDAWEQEYSYVAMHINDIIEKKDERVRILNDAIHAREALMAITESTSDISIGDKLLEDIRPEELVLAGGKQIVEDRMTDDIETTKLQLKQLEEMEQSYTDERREELIQEGIQLRLEQLKVERGEMILLEQGFNERNTQITQLYHYVVGLPDTNDKAIAIQNYEDIKTKLFKDIEVFNAFKARLSNPDLIGELKTSSENDVISALTQIEIKKMKYRGEIKQLQSQLGELMTKDISAIENLTLNDNPMPAEGGLTIESATENLRNIMKAFNQINSKSQYTHCELDPNAILGIAASIIPHPDHNQAPRNTYQCNMGKQALGIYNSAHMYRFDTTSKVLASPNRPLFYTQMYDILGLDQFPAGNMVILAIMAYKGYNQEDAIIVKRGALERGLFQIAVYHSVVSVITKNGRVGGRPIQESFGIPDASFRRVRDPTVYRHLDNRGIAKIGSDIVRGDCLIGKIQKIGSNQPYDNSIYATVDTIGVVDRIVVLPDRIKMKIRQKRTPQAGDKFASRHAQKSTIGLIVNDEDMPFTKNGVSPDIIMNPHAIPSRMTIGQVIEIIASKHAALSGEAVDSTAYGDFDLDKLKRGLYQYGYNPSGYETMTSGLTGKTFKGQIYIGPCYYQALKHHVKDKIQGRSIGSVDVMTRQPVAGRDRGGGLRFGEMERDALISHGASAVLEERLCLSSDAYKTIYCGNCNIVASYNSLTKEYVCQSCEGGAFGTCQLPYPIHALNLLQSGANMRMKMHFEQTKSIKGTGIGTGLYESESDI